MASQDEETSARSAFILSPAVKWAAAFGLGLAAIAAMVAVATYAPGSVALTLGLFAAAFVALYALWRGAFWPSATARGEVPWDAAFDHMPEALFITSRGGRLVYANGAYRDLLMGLGYRRQMSLSRALARERALSPILYRLEVSARRGTAVREEIVMQGPGGRLHRWCVEASPLSKPTRFVLWRVADVGTEYRVHGDSGAGTDFLDKLSFPAFRLDARGSVIMVNEEGLALLNADGDDLVYGTRFDALFGGVTPEQMKPAPDEPVGAPRLIAPRAFARRNADRPVSLWRVPGSRPMGTTVICMDAVPDAKAVEDGDLAATVSRIMDAAPLATALISKEGRIIRCNAEFERMAGRSGLADASLLSLVDEASEEAAGDLLAAEGPAAPEARLPQISFEAQPVDKDGQRPIATAFVAPVGEDGTRILMAFDVSEQKKLEQQFHQAQKMQTVGRLAGGIAHDFNNLLTAIIGFCDLLLQRHQVGDPSFADINQIRQNAARAANLTRQLLAFSRRQNLVPKVLNLTDLLADNSALLRRLLGEKIDYEFSFEREDGRIKADEGQITQVLTNLVVNARDAIRENTPGQTGKVTVRTKSVGPDEVLAMGHSFMPPANYELIEVTDTGGGIPDDIKDQIFEPFFTTKAQGEGTGLGLSTVYGIVKQTGGFIFVDSDRGVGTTFRIYLPAYEGEERAASEDQVKDEPASDTTGQGVVLLVEDETAVRAFAARALTMRGYTVIEAEDGEDALRLYEEHEGPIDLVVSDVVMPGLDGPGLVEQLRADNPDLKVVFMSGYAEDSFRKQLEESGGEVHFLPKPFSLPQLTGMVRKVMGAEEEAA
jgi:two-component system cell cycle sensor histidine kinase/response regulator CckA